MNVMRKLSYRKQMFFKNNVIKLSVALLIFPLLFSSCGDKRKVTPLKFQNAMDPVLIRNSPDGKAAWWDTNTIYYFEEVIHTEKDSNMLFYKKKHLRAGQKGDTITTDSVWGRMYVDTLRKNITFDLHGYITRGGDTVRDPLNSTTWHYAVSDTSLYYESSTTLGTLTPYNP